MNAKTLGDYHGAIAPRNDRVISRKNRRRSFACGGSVCQKTMSLQIAFHWTALPGSCTIIFCQNLKNVTKNTFSFFAVILWQGQKQNFPICVKYSVPFDHRLHDFRQHRMVCFGNFFYQIVHISASNPQYDNTLFV
jgi:hypothetical protein